MKEDESPRLSEKGTKYGRRLFPTFRTCIGPCVSEKLINYVFNDVLGRLTAYLECLYERYRFLVPDQTSFTQQLLDSVTLPVASSTTLSSFE